MHRHKTLEALLCTLVFTVTVTGCWTPITSHDFAATPTPDVSDLHPGDYCKIATAVSPGQNPSCYHLYSGTVASMTNKEIVLNNSIDESILEYGMPVIDDIPILNTPLRTQRTGHAEVGTVRLPRAEITSFVVCEPPKSAKAPPSARVTTTRSPS